MSALLPGVRPSQQRRPPVMLGIAGTRVALHADPPDAVAPFLAAHRHFPPGVSGELLRVTVLARGPVPRIRFPEFAPEQVRRLIERGPEGRFGPLPAAERSGAALYQDRLLELAPAIARGSDGCDVLEPRLLASYLELLLLNAALDRAPNLTPAHAAAVARGRQAALVLGDGGAGKSTLTLALLRCGCAYLSDEVALLDAETGNVRAYPRSLGIREGALSLVEELNVGLGALSTVSLGGDRKWLLDPAVIALAGIGAEAALAHLWFLRGFASAPQITAADPWWAAQRLARSLRHARGTAMDRLWTAIEVVRRCRVLDVVAGPPHVTAAALTRRMEEG